MIQIKIPEQLPEEIEAWKVRALEITGLILAAADLNERRNLIDKYQNHWRKEELINWLSDIGSEKCWYTETKFGGDYQEVEHFRPKKSTKEPDGTAHANHTGYYWLAFDLDNYRLCKRRPNAKKDTFFPILDENNRASCEHDSYSDELPLFLDPMDEEDYLLLSFDDNGKPVPATNIQDHDKPRVLFTIDKYFLDERILNLRRAETWKAARDLFYGYLNSMKEAKATPKTSLTKLAQAKRDLKNLKVLLKSSSEFSSVAKAALMKIDDDVAARILLQ